LPPKSTRFESAIAHVTIGQLCFGSSVASPIFGDVRGRRAIGTLLQQTFWCTKPDRTVELVGICPSLVTASDVWDAKSQRTIDNTNKRSFIADPHQLLDPDADRHGGR